MRHTRTHGRPQDQTYKKRCWRGGDGGAWEPEHGRGERGSERSARRARGEAHAFCRVFAAVTMGSTFERGDGGFGGRRLRGGVVVVELAVGHVHARGPDAGARRGERDGRRRRLAALLLVGDPRHVDGEAHRDEAGGERADERRDEREGDQVVREEGAQLRLHHRHDLLLEELAHLVGRLPRAAAPARDTACSRSAPRCTRRSSTSRRRAATSRAPAAAIRGIAATSPCRSRR